MRPWVKGAIVGLAGLVAAGSMTFSALELVGSRLSEPVSPVSVSPPVLVPASEDLPEDGGSSPGSPPSSGRGSLDDPIGSKIESPSDQGPTSSDGSADASSDDLGADDFDD